MSVAFFKKVDDKRIDLVPYRGEGEEEVCDREASLLDVWSLFLTPRRINLKDGSALPSLWPSELEVAGSISEGKEPEESSLFGLFFRPSFNESFSSDEPTASEKILKKNRIFLKKKNQQQHKKGEHKSLALCGDCRTLGHRDAVALIKYCIIFAELVYH